MKTGAFYSDASTGESVEITLNEETQTFNIVLNRSGNQLMVSDIPLAIMVERVIEGADKGEIFDANTYEWMPF